MGLERKEVEILPIFFCVCMYCVFIDSGDIDYRHTYIHIQSHVHVYIDRYIFCAYLFF